MSSQQRVDRTLLKLYRAFEQSDENQILLLGISAAEQLTHSGIGYVHFVNSDQTTIEFGAWSAATKRICNEVENRHYSLDRAGIWGDSARMRRAVVHNDYLAEVGSKGLPEGHLELIRHLSVPVCDKTGVRLLMGVGNKPQPYGDDDLAAVQQVADLTWALVAKRRQEEALASSVRLAHSSQQLLRYIEWTWDEGEDRFTWHGNFFALMGGHMPPDSLQGLLQLVDRQDQQVIRAAFSNCDHREGPIHLTFSCSLAGEQTSEYRLMAQRRRRARGNTFVLKGILQDLTLHQELELARSQAVSDSLTPLMNRRGFLKQVDKLLTGNRRHFEPLCALFLIDLDGFKPINDTHGHEVGDKVLIETATRIAQRLRRADISARLGGDEFVVMLMGVEHAEYVAAVAAEMVATLNQPIRLESVGVAEVFELGISVSLGGVVFQPGAPAMDWPALYRQADRLMYQAKKSALSQVIETF